MSFSSAVIVSVLFFFITHASASVIPNDKIVEAGNSGEFKVHIRERGTKFVEEIRIDEENDLEYFHVPAHNGLTEADYLYDFRGKMSVSRVKSEESCYLRPLPDSLPKPSDLKTGLQKVPQTPPSEHKIIVQKYWAVSEHVDRTLLRQEAQDFCGQFPIFRLKEVDLNFTTGLVDRDLGHTRLERDVITDYRKKISGLPFCDMNALPTLATNSNGEPVSACNPDDFIFTISIRGSGHCTWWLICKFDKKKSLRCEDWDHEFSSMICYNVRCPP